MPAGDDGVRADGRKELVALADGYRESGESWADLLRDARAAGCAPRCWRSGDGALGFWGALREVFPQAREQRCWFHKIANVLGALPKSAHPGAKKALAEIWNAEDRRHALDAGEGLRGRLRGEVPQGHREDHRRPRGAARVLRLPRRTLDPPAHDKSDRVDLRHRPAPDQDHPGAGFTRRGAGDGVQAHRGRPGPLAGGERPAPGRARPCRRDIRQRQARRTTRRTPPTEAA